MMALKHTNFLLASALLLTVIPAHSADPEEFGYDLVSSDIRAIGTQQTELRLCPNNDCQWRAYQHASTDIWSERSEPISRQKAIELKTASDQRQHFAFVNNKTRTLIHFSFGGLAEDSAETEQPNGKQP